MNRIGRRNVLLAWPLLVAYRLAVGDCLGPNAEVTHIPREWNAGTGVLSTSREPVVGRVLPSGWVDGSCSVEI